MHIIKLEKGEDALVLAAAELFDEAPVPAATSRYLSNDTHHIFIAYEDDQPVGFATGVEMTHPDKGTEMFLYELGVAEQFRRRGIGSALTQALRDRAKERGCYGMWVLTDSDNTAALRTYQKAGASDGSQQIMLSWDL